MTPWRVEGRQKVNKNGSHQFPKNISIAKQQIILKEKQIVWKVAVQSLK